ncbi:amidohydrolase family protein [Leptolyngbya sp. 7M]|uniref:amidohydrolase family protein n=1 Tax=Leptolyngbya sp. 7M TaxID=2812896 RepID=UPI001B8C43BB|nr:amidohydrolase family protein [Leptolyngbya sp. 7M]QYO67145.1 amidohydrolase family protein [Leptolyngbya sp. 7M]
MKLLAAEYLLPIDTGPIRDGVIAIDDGRIVAVGKRESFVSSFPGVPVTDFGTAAILPGFVNCHSHLELTSLRGALDRDEHDFRGWLLKLNSLRAEMTPEDLENAAYNGAIEGAQAGVTFFADIARFGDAAVRGLARSGLRGIVFQETEFSPDNRTAETDMKALAEKFEKLYGGASSLVHVGLSPHSPYTVSSKLFELIAQYSIINRIPLSIHVAESKSEMELFIEGQGFFTEVYEQFGVEWNSPLCSPVQYLERLGVLSARPLLAHCVRVTDEDLIRISSNGSAIAHCPRSNAKFGHGTAPFAKFLENGIVTGLGSDSVASNNTCDLIEESRFAVLSARNMQDPVRFLTARDGLYAATLGGAGAVGMASEIGSLTPGKFADITVISLDNVAQKPINDVEAAIIFSSNARDVVCTMVAGEIVYSANKKIGLDRPIPDRNT